MPGEHILDSLVSTDWLAGQLGAPDLVVLDATYHALDPARDARAEYERAHIPGAVHLDLRTLADANAPLPGMAPDAQAFAERLSSLGIRTDDRIVLYDSAPHRTSARAWWLMRLFGIDSVAILDGGLAKWQAEGRAVDQGGGRSHAAQIEVINAESALVRDMGQMMANVSARREEVVDARGAARFTGAERDPRGGVAPGHIPGSKNLPYDRLFQADGTWKRGEALRAVFDAAGVDLSKPLVTTCGSGVTAAVVLFGAHLLGKRDLALYDGSWSEWGAHPDTPKSLGAAA